MVVVWLLLGASRQVVLHLDIEYWQAVNAPYLFISIT